MASSVPTSYGPLFGSWILNSNGASLSYPTICPSAVIQKFKYQYLLIFFNQSDKICTISAQNNFQTLFFKAGALIFTLNDRNFVLDLSAFRYLKASTYLMRDPSHR